LYLNNQDIVGVLACFKVSILSFLSVYMEQVDFILRY